MIDLSKPWWKWSAKCYFIEGRDVVALAKELERQNKVISSSLQDSQCNTGSSSNQFPHKPQYSILSVHPQDAHTETPSDDEST